MRLRRSDFPVDFLYDSKTVVHVNYGSEIAGELCFADKVVQANVLVATATDAAALGQVCRLAVGGRTTLALFFVLLRQSLSENCVVCAGESHYSPSTPSMCAIGGKISERRSASWTLSLAFEFEAGVGCFLLWRIGFLG